VFFFDEAWWFLCGEVNYQNNQYWRADKPRLINKFPVHDERLVSGVQQEHAG
jgi:hypothetical protein